MADNVAITEGAGTTIAADEVGGVKFQRVKLAIGADGTAVDVSPGTGGVDTGTLRVVLANNDPAVSGIGATSDAAATAGSTGSLNAKLRLATTLLDAIKTAVEAMDDWDESDRAKVNLIAGQAGIAAGAGAISAATPRVTPAGYGYETVAASQTAQVLGATGAAGDLIMGVLVIPATTSPGNVILLDNATSITIFAGGASSVATLVPFFVPLGMISASGAWKLTTGANVSAIGIGAFT